MGEVPFSTPTDPLPMGMFIPAIRVPSAGSITLNICNVTGGASPAVTGLAVRAGTVG